MLVRQELLDFLAKEGLTVVNVTHVFEGCQGGTSHTSSSIIIVSHMAKRIKKKDESRAAKPVGSRLGHASATPGPGATTRLCVLGEPADIPRGGAAPTAGEPAETRWSSRNRIHFWLSIQKHVLRELIRGFSEMDPRAYM